MNVAASCAWIVVALTGLSLQVRASSESSDSFKKITQAPRGAVPSGAEEILLQADPEKEEGADVGPASETPVPSATVTTSPAPGTAHATAPDASIEVIKAHLNKRAAAPGKAPVAPESAHAEPKPSAAAKNESKDGVAPETSLRWLSNGNARYFSKHFRADGRMPADRQRLLSGQHPHAIVLACSDSTTPPEIVFDQALGEIYTVRVAGEALDASVIGSIEDAVLNTGAKLLVVMGHTQCPMIQTAMQTKDGDSSESLDHILADIRPRLKSIPQGKGSANLEIEATVNADGVARELVKRSEIIRKKVEAGELVIKPALYRMDSGRVSFY